MFLDEEYELGGIAAGIAATLYVLLVFVGCAAPSPCLSTVTTYAEGGPSWGDTRDRLYDIGYAENAPARGTYDGADVRFGVSLEWDATGYACAPDDEPEPTRSKETLSPRAARRRGPIPVR